MAKGSSKATKTSSSQATKAKASAESKSHESRITGAFIARYTSLVGVHTTLLAFIALFLPRTTFFFELTTPFVNVGQQTSKDRPQHPFLVPLTQSPTSTLLCLSAGVLILQGWWGGWLRQWQQDITTTRTSNADDPAEKRAQERVKFSQAVEAWSITLLSALVLQTVFILFGAPLIQYASRTFLLALLIAVLTVFPAAYALGTPRWSGSDVRILTVRMTWVRLFAEFSPKNPVERALAYPLLGAFLGAWIGIIPIALDWDRPWQAWPLTPAYGSILGYIIASMGAVGTSLLRQLAEEHIKASLAEKKAA